MGAGLTGAAENDKVSRSAVIQPLQLLEVLCRHLLVELGQVRLVPGLADIVVSNPDTNQEVLPIPQGRCSVKVCLEVIDLVYKALHRGCVRGQQDRIGRRATNGEVIGKGDTGVELDQVEAQPVKAARGRPARERGVAQDVGRRGQGEVALESCLGSRATTVQCWIRPRNRMKNLCEKTTHKVKKCFGAAALAWWLSSVGIEAPKPNRDATMRLRMAMLWTGN